MRFSIVTIAYNAADDIEDTLKSVLDQNYSDFEYIIVDGASKDGTVDVIEKYLSLFADKGIRIKFKSEPDGGISDAFNKGVSQAEGEIVSIINAGDCLFSDALQTVSKHMDTDILYGNIVWNDETHGFRYVRKASPDLHNLMFNMVIMHPATFVKKQVYDKVGLFDTSFRFAMDQEMMVRMQKAGMKFKYIDKELVEMKAGGASDSNLRKVLDECDRIPMLYGAPKLKILLFRNMKYWRTKLAHIVRHFKKPYLQS